MVRGNLWQSGNVRHGTLSLELGLLLEYEVTQLRDTGIVVYFSQFPIHTG